MNNLPIQTYESVVQQRDALLVELHNLKSAITERIHLNEEIKKAGTPPHSDFWHQSIYMADKKVKEALSDTQATDAFTRELMAKGVDDAASSLFGAGYSFDLLMGYVAQLRKGVNDAQ